MKSAKVIDKLLKLNNKYGELLENQYNYIEGSGGYNPDNTVSQIKYIELMEMIQTDLDNLI